jgi:oxalyl-CoA decarboxylase
LGWPASRSPICCAWRRTRASATSAFRHEQSAANAAAIAGYLTQKPGICMTVSAPGFLNGMVALANATTNCFPMILISGSSDRAIVDLEQGDYEEMDQLNAPGRIARRPTASTARRISASASRGRSAPPFRGDPGGVYLDLTAEVLGSALDAKPAKKSLVKVVDPAPASESGAGIDRARHRPAGECQRPLVILGKGAAYARADAEIRSFIETTGIPFLPMSMAKGLLPDEHPQSAAAARSYAIGNADVVMLAGARLNWLLSHGRAPLWNADTKFVQIDISPTEFDSNRAIAAPVVGDIKSVFAAFNAALKPGKIERQAAWVDEIGKRKQQNVERMAARLNADPSPMNFSSALRAVRNALATQPDVYIVNEGANTLDFGRNIIDMDKPRHRLDSGTWGVMGIGMGYAVGAAAVTGKPVVAIEGDSAFGFSGMEIETICRYELPVTTIIFNNNGVYRGDAEGRAVHADRPPARRALREDHRGVRRRRLPLHRHAQPHQGADRGARLGQAGAPSTPSSTRPPAPKAATSRASTRKERAGAGATSTVSKRANFSRVT